MLQNFTPNCPFLILCHQYENYFENSIFFKSKKNARLNSTCRIHSWSIKREKSSLTSMFRYIHVYCRFYLFEPENVQLYETKVNVYHQNLAWSLHKTGIGFFRLKNVKNFAKFSNFLFFASFYERIKEHVQINLDW